jgi:uncharacterized protein (DUF1501 family)
MQRRNFLCWASLSLVFPTGAIAVPSVVSPQPTAPQHSRSLVLVELKGGNDGLNTLIPYADPEYARLRPNLAIAPARVLNLTDRLGLHPALRPLMPAWEAGELAWIQGVGYPWPNRSHFRSIDIWETGSASDEVLEQGWLARQLPIRAPGDLPDVVVLGGDDGPARGGDLRIITLESAERFVSDARRLRPLDAPPAHLTAALDHLLTVRAATQAAGAEFRRSIARLDTTPTPFPKSALGHQLQEAARMLQAGMAIPVFKVQIGSFDSHANQLARHERLLAQLADALASFRQTLQHSGHWDRVLVMSYSEFGRRPAENASGGTDHGTAAPHLVLGGQVKGGLYGGTPDLNALEQSDLRHTVDYRRLYDTVAGRWWNDPPLDIGAKSPDMAWL